MWFEALSHDVTPRKGRKRASISILCEWGKIPDSEARKRSYKNVQ